jgi:hypothetical protein
MKKEVKRSVWSKFCRKFSSDNQYRNGRLGRSSKESTQVALGPEYPFLGISLEKKGRLIDGIQIIAGRGDAEQILDTVFSLKNPDKLMVEEDSAGNVSRLEVKSKEGHSLMLELEGGKERQQFYSLVERVAYNIYERRGGVPGGDWNDWIEAERKVKDAESQLTL